jgi:hypothetical protein
MKKLIVLAIIMAFIAGIPSAALANGVDIKNISQWCKANDDWGYSSHGKCVSMYASCNAPDNEGPVCACKDALAADPDTFYIEYNNLGDCISVLKNGYITE